MDLSIIIVSWNVKEKLKDNLRALFESQNVNFDVMIAELPVKSGSSGSVAVNVNFEVVGLIFAGNFTNGSNVADYAFLIPIDQVKAFLTTNELAYHEVES